MLLTASTLALTISMTAGAADPARSGSLRGIETSVRPTVLTAASQAPVPASSGPVRPTLAPAWMADGPARPKGLAPMYATLGVLQALDIYSTRRALAGGSSEVNPMMRTASQSSAGMTVAKALSTAGSIYFAERAWKKNRKGAMILMAAINGVTAAVVANNLRNAR